MPTPMSVLPIRKVFFPVLCAITLLLIHTSASAQLCTSIFGHQIHDSSLGEALGDATCEVIWSNEDGSPPSRGIHKIIKPIDWPANFDSPGSGLVDTIKTAIDDSIMMLENLNILSGSEEFNTTFLIGIEVITDQFDARGTKFHFQHTEFLPDNCPVVLNFGGVRRGINLDLVSFVVAHEMYHCFQSYVYNNGFNALDDWWVEGLAEFFAHTTYPTFDREHGFASLYESSLRVFEHQVDSLPYATVAFFLWLETRGQQTQIYQRMNSLAEYDQRTSQYFQRILSHWPEIDSNFHEFAKVFYGEAFIESSGSQVPVTESEPVAAELEIDTENSTAWFEIDVPAFIIEAQRIVLEPGRRYAFRSRESETPGMFSVRENSGDWSELPEFIETDCDAPSDLDLLITSTASSPEESYEPYTVKLDLEWEPSKECGCTFAPVTEATIESTASGCATTSPFDRCLIGVWELEAGSYRKQLERLSPGEVLAADASARIAVTSDGLSDACLSSTFHTQMDMRGVQADVKGQTNATSTHQLSISGAGKLCSTEIVAESSTETTVTVAGQVMTNTIPGQAAPFTLESEYVCDENKLTIRSFPPGVDYVEQNYLRVD